MKSFWLRSRTKYMALARRERGLLMFAALVLCFGVGTLLFVEPAYKQLASMQQQITQQQVDLAALRPQVLALQARQRDPNAATSSQLKALRQQLQLADGEFAQVQSALVQPQEMGHLLESLLRSHRGLQLVSLRSLPVMSVADLINAPRPASAATAVAAVASAASQAMSANTSAKDAWLYRHGVEITVQGSYADMQAYLAALENLPRRVYWGELKIDAQRWPANVMAVTVYTISLERTWWRV